MCSFGLNVSFKAAPSSTKIAKGERDPEMHLAKKGGQWHFRMKMHTGVDADSGLIHSVVCTAANESDVAHAHEAPHGRETTFSGDSSYTVLRKRAEITGAQQQFLRTVWARCAVQGSRNSGLGFGDRVVAGLLVAGRCVANQF